MLSIKPHFRDIIGYDDPKRLEEHFFGDLGEHTLAGIEFRSKTQNTKSNSEMDFLNIEISIRFSLLLYISIQFPIHLFSLLITLCLLTLVLFYWFFSI